MKPASHVAGGSGSTSASLGNWFNTKKKRMNSVYSHSASYKKPKNSKVSVSVVNSSAGLLGLANIGNVDGKFSKSWGSEIKSEASSMNDLSDLENMKNTVTKETSYADLDNSVVDSIEDNIMPRKMHTCIYVLGQPLKTPSFDVLSNNEDMVVLSSPKFKDSNQLLSIKLHVSEKRNFKPVKSFTLDIELSIVPRKMNSNKLIAIKKNFYRIDGFRKASTSLKFSGIIRSSFTSESSLNKAKKLAIFEKILVNNNLKKINSQLNRKIIVKEIPVDLLRLAVELVFSRFGRIVSIKMQLIELWQKAIVEFESSKVASLVAFKWSVFMGKDSVCVALANEDKQIWVLRDQHQALLYTFPIGTTVHDLSGLLKLYGGKTCFIGHNPNEASKLVAIGSVLVFKSVSLCWAGFLLVCCAKCKHFGHVSNVCSVGGIFGVHRKQVVTDWDQVYLAGIYKKKWASITCPVSFGEKTWAQIVGGFSLHVVFSAALGVSSVLGANSPPLASTSLVVSELNNCLASLEHFLEILSNQVFGILKKLSFVELVPLAPFSCASFLAVSVPVAPVLDSNMALDGMLMLFPFPLPGVDKSVNGFSSSSLKILTLL
ncbi:hypothetical protein G9A89_008997 [Geosiphon pyriformis]|nr:hypothetical protein G9A89_008997 [Geosiphon pyriformis]